LNRNEKIMAKNNRILPELDAAIEYAKQNHWITDADVVGITQLYVLAGVIDNASLKPIELASLCRQFQQILDSYNLSPKARKEIVEESNEVTPLDNLREIVRTIKPKNTDDNLYQLP
jgi:small ligand-binding sensory domain FIST